MEGIINKLEFKKDMEVECIAYMGPSQVEAMGLYKALDYKRKR